MQVSVAIIAYNEEKILPSLLKDLAAQDYPHEKLEVLLIDSLSTDRTWEIMEDFQKNNGDFGAIRLLKNPGGNQPCGRNVMLENFTGEALVQIDAHAAVPADFVSKNVKVLQSGEKISGGARPNIIDGETPWKRTLLTAEQSMFGSSIASYRHSTKKQYVNSVFHGMYHREVFRKVGRYNELLIRSEDNDMSYRIRQAGYRICYDPEIVSYQHTRSTLKSMLRQKYLNGYWIGKTMGINPHCFSLFHFVPFAFVLGILFTTALTLLGWPQLGWLMWGAYGALLLAITVMELIRNFSLTNLLLPVLFFLLHASYGIGTLVGLAEMPFWIRSLKKERGHE